MPHRDPDTGRFVAASVEDVPWHETRAVEGNVSVEIPAADLSGGTTIHEALTDDDIEWADFDQVVDADEIFELRLLQATVAFSIHTTATGQSFATAGYAIAENLQDRSALQSPPFWNTTSEVDNYDIITDNRSASEILYAGKVNAVAQTLDSTNSLASGPGLGYDSFQIAYPDMDMQGPIYDADDSLFAPVRFHTDAVSDMAVEINVTGHVRGVVHELD